MTSKRIQCSRCALALVALNPAAEAVESGDVVGRPTIKDVTFLGGKSYWHTIFDRRPTPEGLTLLGHTLADSKKQSAATSNAVGESAGNDV